MSGEKRRQEILKKLQNGSGTISGKALAQEFSVSRQIIVQDMALLRAGGFQIEATNRGYRILGKGTMPAVEKSVVDKKRLEQQMNFCKEIDKEKLIKRQTYLSNGIQKENDSFLRISKYLITGIVAACLIIPIQKGVKHLKKSK